MTIFPLFNAVVYWLKNMVLINAQSGLLQWLITYLLLTAIIAIRYILIAWLFHWLLTNRADKLSARNLTKMPADSVHIKNDIFWSLGASFIYAFPIIIALKIYIAGDSAVYVDVNQYPLWYIPVSIIVYMFLHDTYFYWVHRIMHLRPLFPVLHKVHHQSRPVTAWSSFSFHPYESLILAFFLPLLTWFIPIHPISIFFILIVMTLSAVLNHCGWELFPEKWLRSWFGEIFITATHHNVHHQNYRCNLGLYFRFWDKLAGTDIMEQQLQKSDYSNPTL